MNFNTSDIAESIPLGILVFNAEGRVELSNENLSSLLPLGQDNQTDIFQFGKSLGLSEELKALLKGQSFEKEMRSFRTLSGVEISVLVKGSPMKTGGILVVEDLRTETRLKSIIENIAEFIWTADFSSGKPELFYTNGVEKVLGYKANEFIRDKRLWIRIVHPDDVSACIKSLKRFYCDKALMLGTHEFRAIRKDGARIWLRHRLSIKRDKNGAMLQIFGILSDVTIQKDHEENLLSVAGELKKTNEAKDKFISIISHDLRTPFSSILGFADILLDDADLTEKKKRDYVLYIRESAKNMLSLVNSLLDWSRIETGRIKFEPERLDMKLLADKAVSINSGEALKKNILLENLLQDVEIEADGNLILMLLNNLIGNALKFTYKGGHISMTQETSDKSGFLVFSIRDTGKGIRKEDLPKLFHLHTKFTTEGTGGEKGSGLGLALCKEIVLKHGGDIRAESEEGQGSSFIFSLPAPKECILLVDSAGRDRILYHRLIESLFASYRVVDADSAEFALKLMESLSPAVLITEHILAGKSGYDLLQELRRRSLDMGKKTIILSSEMNRVIEESYRNLGVEYIFGKPVNLGLFKAAIEGSIKKSVLIDRLKLSLRQD